MNNKLLVSVLIPFRNHSPYIQRSIESILNQTHKVLEVILIDDGSDEDTLKILSTFDDIRIKVVRNEGVGISSALNTGLKLARGQYIARMDADDVCSSIRLEKQLQFLNMNPHIDLVGTACEYFGAKHGRTYPPLNNSEMLFGLAVNNPLLHASIIFRREIYDSGDFQYDLNASGDEDYRLWVKLLFKGYEFANINEPLYFYRIYEGNAHGNTSSNFAIKQATVGEILRRFDFPSIESFTRELVAFHYDRKLTLRRLYFLKRFAGSSNMTPLIFGELNLYLKRNRFQILMLLSVRPIVRVSRAIVRVRS